MTRKDFHIVDFCSGFIIGVGVLALLAIRITERTSLHVHQQEQSNHFYQQLEPAMNWDKLIICRPMYRSDIAKYIPDEKWQSFRISLLNEPLHKKFLALERWVQDHNYDQASCVQVTNYVYALKRGGLI